MLLEGKLGGQSDNVVRQRGTLLIKEQASHFMDTFQSHYKDGTETIEQHRALVFSLEVLYYTIANCWSWIEDLNYTAIIYFVAITSLFYGIIHPCKKYMNSVVYCAAGLLLCLGSQLHCQAEVIAPIWNASPTYYPHCSSYSISHSVKLGGQETEKLLQWDSQVHFPSKVQQHFLLFRLVFSSSPRVLFS